MAEHPVDCATVDARMAELALEIVDGPERDALLAHVATCERCATELYQISTVADRLTLLAPEAEPSAGFEQRVMHAIAGSQSPSGASSVAAPSHRRPRPALLAAAVIALLAIGLTVG